MMGHDSETPNVSLDLLDEAYVTGLRLALVSGVAVGAADIGRDLTMLRYALGVTLPAIQSGGVGAVSRSTAAGGKTATALDVPSVAQVAIWEPNDDRRRRDCTADGPAAPPLLAAAAVTGVPGADKAVVMPTFPPSAPVTMAASGPLLMDNLSKRISETRTFVIPRQTSQTPIWAPSTKPEDGLGIAWQSTRYSAPAAGPGRQTGDALIPSRSMASVVPLAQATADGAAVPAAPRMMPATVTPTDPSPAAPGSTKTVAPSSRHTQSSAAPTGGDVYLDGTRMGRWMAASLAREAGRPQGGSTFFDPRMAPAWPGTLQGA
jgi:hypothetical protein